MLASSVAMLALGEIYAGSPVRQKNASLSSARKAGPVEGTHTVVFPLVYEGIYRLVVEILYLSSSLVCALPG